MKYSYSIPNHGSSGSHSLKILAAKVLKFPTAGVFLSDLKFSQTAMYPFYFLNGSLNKDTGFTQISESLVTAYPVEEPS